MHSMTGVALLEFYIEKWGMYCTSIVHIAELLSPFAALVETLTGFCLDFVSLMRTVWLENVHTPLEPVLNQSLMRELSGEWRLIRTTGEYSYDSVCTYMGYVDCLCDLSLDEASIYLKKHCSLALCGPLQVHTESLLSALPPIDLTLGADLLQTLDVEARLLSCVLLPCTLVEVHRARLQQIEECLSDSPDLQICHRTLKETVALLTVNSFSSLQVLTVSGRL